MNRTSITLFVTAGALAWLGCTGFYAAYGAALIERSFWFYAVNAGLCAVGMALTFHALTRVLRIPTERQLAAAACFGLPMLVLSLAITPALSSLFNRAAPETLGRYAGYLLFAWCGAVFVALSPVSRAPVAVPAH